jgi:hypothetical protein
MRQPVTFLPVTFASQILKKGVYYNPYFTIDKYNPTVIFNAVKFFLSSNNEII